MYFPSRGKVCQTGRITHDALSLSCIRFCRSCLGKLVHPTGFRIIHRKLRQQSEGIFPYFRGIGCRPSATDIPNYPITLTGSTSRDHHFTACFNRKTSSLGTPSMLIAPGCSLSPSSNHNLLKCGGGSSLQLTPLCNNNPGIREIYREFVIAVAFLPPLILKKGQYHACIDGSSEFQKFLKQGIIRE